MSELIYSRQLVKMVELDLDFCAWSYGVGSCTATGSADGKCYNTHTTCQVRDKYSAAPKTYKFTLPGTGGPVGETLRPYLKSVDIAPTEIKQDEGLSRRGSITAKFVDEPDNDAGIDPYVTDRTAPAQATFWTRLMARNKNYADRPARVKRGYVDSVGGTWVTNSFTNELYIIDSIKGPSENGDVSITLKDMLKLTDKAKLPAVTPGKVTSMFLPTDTQMWVNSGDGDYYPGSGFIRIGEQIIEFYGKSVPYGWNFEGGTMESWVGSGCTLASSQHALRVDITSNAPQFSRENLALDGTNWRFLAMRLKANTAINSWDGRVTYGNNVHSYSPNSYYAQVGKPAGVESGYVTAVWDMHALAVGSYDWRGYTTTALRFDLGINSGAQLDIDWIAYSPNSIVTADILNWPLSSYRSKFNTTASSEAANSGVQLCLVYSGAAVTSVMLDLLYAAGVTSAYIDHDAFVLEESDWLGTKYNVTVALHQPEAISDMLAELCQQTNSVLWWSPTAQKVKIKVITPPNPALITGNLLTDAGNVIDGSLNIARQDSRRITSAAVYYGLISAVADKLNQTNYRQSEVYTDSSAESANEYGDSIQHVMYSRVASLRDAPDEIIFDLDPKDNAVEPGAVWDFKAWPVIGFNGAQRLRRIFLTKRTDRDNGIITLKSETTVFDRRYAFIAPNSIASYSTATSAQLNYAFVCNSSGGFSFDNSSGYIEV
jgi:ethanolamine utilization microcompartment shell protein EutS